MEKLIQIQDQESFRHELRLMIREELRALLNSNSHIPEEDKILTRDDIMVKYNISPGTLWKRMRDRSIPYFKIGRRVYFNERLVNEALNSKD